MPSASKVLKEVLKQARPTKEQRRKLESLAKKALSLSSKLARKYKAKAMLVGSLTRDTWLPDKMEFDIFVLFPEKLTEKNLEKAGLQLGKSVIEKLKGEWVIAYAEHPYVSGMVNGVDIDIVPAYAVASAEKIKSAVDRTPFHVKFIEKNLPFSLSNEVRLLKKFLKSHNIYGGDAKTEGFPGYLCELLVVAYKSFTNVLKAAEKWNVGEIIDLKKAYKKEDYQNLRKKFGRQALILIDPTDKNRNVAAALAPRNFFKFKKISRDFVSKPTVENFLGKKYDPITEKELIELQMKRRTELIVVKFLPPKTVPDVLWPQLKKFGERLQTILEEAKYEFKVYGNGVFTDEKFIAAAVLEMEVSKLPAVQKRVGPSIFDFKDSDNFISKYKDQALTGPYIEGSSWVVEIKRQFTCARDKLVDSLSVPVDVLKAKGVPNLIAERIAHGFEIFSETDRILEETKRNPEFGIFLRKFFEKEKLV